LKQKIAIYGASDLGREILVLVRQVNQASDHWDIIGFYDDALAAGTLVAGLPVLGGLAELNTYPEPLYVCIAISDPVTKKKITENIHHKDIKFPVLIHPSVGTGDFQQLVFGEGTIVCAGNVLTCNVHTGRHVLLNLCCTIGHDCVIDDYASMMPGVHLSGKVHVAEGAYIGTAASVINHTHIGRYATVGAGALVNRDVKDYAVVVGVPAKPLKDRSKP
jgi:sugar O-acyltransferase (sialic acid O-acetyltransferase NeuD family)